MKEKILKFFREDRSYVGAIKLYNEIGNNLSVKKQINLQPEKIMKGILFDQFRILAGLSHDDFRIIMSKDVKTAAPVDEKKDDLTIILDKSEKPVKPDTKKHPVSKANGKPSQKQKGKPAKK